MVMSSTQISVEGLASLPEPRSLGARHNPLAHHRFARVIDAALVDHGIEVTHRDLELTHKGNRIFGTYKLRAPDTVQAIGDQIPGTVTPMLGWKNSVDQEFGGRVAMAASVFNCSNTMWMIERGFEVKRKNTRHIEAGVVDLMRSMLKDYWATYMTAMDHQLDLAKDDLADRDAHDLICKGVRRGITATRHAGHVLDAWHDTPFDWGEKSLWRLHNCHTYVLDREVANPYVRSKRNLRLNDMVSGHYVQTHLSERN